MKGLGVMINELFGDNKKDLELFDKSKNKKIKAISVYNDELIFKFDDETGIKFRDDGQSCCETRYMNTDDDLHYFVNSVFLDITIENGPEKSNEKDFEYQESQFLHVKTSKGTFTVANYVEHNGYYGGFSLTIHEVK